jgi:hypothetical protein
MADENIQTYNLNANEYNFTDIQKTFLYTIHAIVIKNYNGNYNKLKNTELNFNIIYNVDDFEDLINSVPKYSFKYAHEASCAYLNEYLDNFSITLKYELYAHVATIATCVYLNDLEYALKKLYKPLSASFKKLDDATAIEDALDALHACKILFAIEDTLINSCKNLNQILVNSDYGTVKALYQIYLRLPSKN